MIRISTIVIAWLFLGFARSLIGGEVKATWTMSEDQHQAVMEVVEKAMACGLPEARGGQLFKGPVSYSLTKGGGTTIDGSDSLHVRLADHSWLLHFVIPVVPVLDVKVDARSLKPIALGELKKEGLYFDRSWSLDRIDPAQRAMFEATKNIDAILNTVVSRGLNRGGITSLYLIRLGVPDAEFAPICLAAYHHNRDDNKLNWNSVRPIFFGATGNSNGAYQEWLQHRRDDIAPPFTLMDPANALRLSLFADAVYAVTAAIDPYLESNQLGKPLPLAVAIALGDAMLADDDVEARRNWERIKVGIKVPNMGNDFASRLATWRGGPRNSMNEDFDRQVRKSRGKSLSEDPYHFSDLDALVALCADERPSLWFDHFQARTIGDQALRAISDIFEMDVRQFVGRDLLSPWTDEERKATAFAVQAWWQQNRQRSMDDIIATAALSLTLKQFASFLPHTDDAHRLVVFNQLAKEWSKPTPNVGYDKAQLASILSYGLQNSSFAKLVDTWDSMPDTRLVLAAWHQVRGRSALLDAWIAEAAAKPEWENAPLGGLRLDDALPLVLAFPTVERVRLIRGMMTFEPLDEPSQNIIFALNLISSDSPGLAFIGIARKEEPLVQKREQAVLALLLISLLDDRRIAPHGLVERSAQISKHVIIDNHIVDVTAGKPLPKDLRIVDCVAASIARHVSSGDFRESPLGDQATKDLLFDFCDPIAKRDASVTRLRQRIADLLPGLLTAAQLQADLMNASDPVHKVEENF